MMTNKGLNKLMEECGELIQIAAKKAAYIDTDNHPDGAGSMRLRMEDEIADVQAACDFVSRKFNLDATCIAQRTEKKLQTFIEWDAQ